MSFINDRYDDSILTRNVRLVIGDEMRDGRLGNFAHVVVTLFHSESSETERRLSTTAVLLRQVDRELVQDLARVALKCAEQGAVTVHDNETKSEI